MREYKTIDEWYITKLGKVKPITDPEKYKAAIITELFLNGIMKAKITGIMYRKRIKKTTLIHEDIEAETFYWLSRRPASELIEMYEDRPARLVGLCVRIAVLKGVASNSVMKDYPKHSVAKNILFASNLQQFHTLSDVDNDLMQGQIILNEQSESFTEMWNVILDNLSEAEIDWMHTYFEQKSKKLNKADTIIYNELLCKIKTIVEINNLII